jgi:hypothetical protein
LWRYAHRKRAVLGAIESMALQMRRFSIMI